MANSDVRRHVRCPRCHGLLQEPAGAPVYQCGGCGATLRAKNRSGVAISAPPSSSSGLPPPPRSGHSEGFGDVVAASTSRSTTPTPDAGDVASTSGSKPGAVAASTRHQETSMASRRDTTTDDDLVSSARKDVSGDDVASTPPPGDVTSSSNRRQATETTRRPDKSAGDLVVPASERATEKKGHDDRSPTTSRGGAYDNNPEFRRRRGTTDDAEHSPSVGVVNFPGGTKDAASTFESQVDDSEKRRKTRAEQPDAARNNKHSQFRDRRQELAPRSSAQAAAEPQQPPPSRDGGKVPMSPPRRELRQVEQDLAPLRRKILKTVDELKGDLSELFSNSPDRLNPTTTRAARPSPRLLRKQGEGTTASLRGAAVASALPAARARHAAVPIHGNAARAAVKPGRVAAAAAPPRRGLPSRRYRRCRADPCCENAQPRRTCQHHGCCCPHHQGKPECSSCRGHCGRPSKAQERKPPAAAAKRRQPPRHHCRPVLKGAPFIICSSCFQLVQVPADFAAVSTSSRLRKLRCGACSTVLSYSYRDPGRKKPHQDFSDSLDQLSTDGGKGYAQPDPFAPFVDDFGLSSYSTTEDEQPPLHVSRNTSFDSVVIQGVGRLHRLMGYGSASELLLRHSPDLYESGFDGERTTPDYDRKGKGVCIDAEDDDDSDEDEDSSVVMRSAARGAVWPMPGTLGKGPGAIRIKS